MNLFPLARLQTLLDINEALNGTLRRMHHVRRYSSVPAIHPENVAEHSWQVAMLCYLIGRDLEVRGITVIWGDLLQKAILHDVSETMSGDIIRSYKHGSHEIRKATQDADYENMVKVTEKLGFEDVAGGMLDQWLTSKNSMLEGQIVALADLLCVVSYCAAEKRLGNDEVDFIMKGMYEESLYMWHDHWPLGQYVDAIFPNKRYEDAYR